MGLAGYYRRFIEGFSNIVHPITSLQKKGVRFEWSTNCARSFHHLNSLLTSAPILRIVDLDAELNCVHGCMQGRSQQSLESEWTCGVI
jgi:hypothetical protein